MSYTDCMAIEHQKIVDEDGNPTAAVIPWDLFQHLQAMHAILETDDEPISEAFKNELNRRVEALKDGTTKAISHDKAMAGLHSLIDRKESA